MRIVHVIPTLVSGGAERIVVDICNKLSENQEVYLVQLTEDKDKRVAFYKNQLNTSISYINLNGKEGKLFNILVFLKFLKLIFRIKPDVIHAHLNIIYILILSLFFKSTKFFYTIHNDAEKECLVIKGHSLKKIIRFFYLKKLIIPITISEESTISFVDFYNINNAVLIENGCFNKEKTQFFQSVVREVDGLKKHKDDKIFLNIGRCVPQKNHEMLINVFNRLIHENEKIILLIIGDGFNSNKGEKIKMKAREGIHFLGTRENVSDYFYICDAFCLSSLWEGLPITLLESLSAGCVPICTPAGGILNVINEDSIGLISKDFSEESYYEIVKRFLDENCSINRDFLKTYFTENFSIDKTVAQLLIQYQ